MKIAKNKTTATLIALFLMLTITVTSILDVLPIANAHSPPWNYNTYSYIAVSPPVVGIGQQELIVFWLNAVPPTAAGAIGDRWLVYIDVTDPDGIKETFGPLTSDSVGGGFISYTPTKLGQYTCVSRFPGQTITGVPGNTKHSSVGDIYAASTSDPTYFTVQGGANPLIRRDPASN